MTNPRRWLINSRVAAREVEGEILLIEPESEEIFSLNETGKKIWEALLEGKDETEIISLLVSSYSIDRNVLIADMNSFLEILVRKGFVGQENG